jgi:sulfite reductase beta subunit-like hemoprotein
VATVSKLSGFRHARQSALLNLQKSQSALLNLQKSQSALLNQQKSQSALLNWQGCAPGCAAQPAGTIRSRGTSRR